MSKPPSEATQLRTAKREAKELTGENWRLRNEVDHFRARATKAEQQCAEWKERFDILLRRDQEKPS